MALAVISDAFFLDNQAYTKVKYKPTANHLLTSANLFTFLFCFSISCIQGKLVAELTFCWEHTSANREILILSVLQAAGQIAIYYVITNFKQHILPLINITRKVMTVLLSIFIYHHSVNWIQWV